MSAFTHTHNSYPGTSMVILMGPSMGHREAITGIHTASHLGLQRIFRKTKTSKSAPSSQWEIRTTQSTMLSVPIKLPQG